VSKPVFEVALALVHRAGRWLVARRYADAHLGGMWEFPGGKCRSDESPSAAAVRELHEECGVRAAAEICLERLAYDYGDRLVNITPVICRWEAGEAHSIASEECRWVSREELGWLEMPPINADILRVLPRVG
jgi:8-oxo-dGTP diphosphatase